MRKFFILLYYSIFRWLPAGNIPIVGGISKRLRRWICRHIFEYCGNNVNIERGAYFGAGDKIRIGENSGIGINCVVPNGSVIGDNVLMGPNCYIHNRNHRFDRIDIPIGQQGYTEKTPITIGNDVWIGRDVSIMTGRRIADGTVVAANSVVTKDFPAYSVIGGNPAKILKMRKEE